LKNEGSRNRSQRRFVHTSIFCVRFKKHDPGDVLENLQLCLQTWIGRTSQCLRRNAQGENQQRIERRNNKEIRRRGKKTKKQNKHAWSLVAMP